MLARVFILWLLGVSVNYWLPAQAVLVDSIAKGLQKDISQAEQMDLLLGMARARVFTDGSATMKEDAERALAFADESNNLVGRGNSLIFIYQADYSDPVRSLKWIDEALDIAHKTDDRNLEIFATYSVIEVHLHDRNDLVMAGKWVRKGMNRLSPNVDHKHRGNLYKNIGLWHEKSGRADSLSHYMKAALKEFSLVSEDFSPSLGRRPSTGWDDGDMNAAHALMYLGRSASLAGKPVLADSLLQISLNLSQRQKADQLTARLYQIIGDNHKKAGRVIDAIDALSAALLQQEKMQAHYYIAQTARGIGELFMTAEDPEVAATYFQRSFDNSVLANDSIKMALALRSMCQAARQTGRLEVARSHIIRSSDIVAAMKDSVNLGPTLIELALTENALHNYPNAISLFREGLAYYHLFNREDLLPSGYLALAETFLVVGELDSADVYGTLAHQYTYAHGSLYERASVNRSLSQIARQRGDLAAALDYLQTHDELSDSLLIGDAQTSLRQEQVRQNVADYRAQKERAERENSLLAERNTLYLALATTLALLIFAGSILFLKLRSARRKLAKQNTQLIQLNADKDRFFGIIAHDLRGPVAALKMVNLQITYYAKRKNISKIIEVSENVEDATVGVSRLLDNLLSWALSQEGKIPFNPEFVDIAEITEDVLEIYRPKANLKGIRMDYDIPSELTAYADRPALHAIVRNLVSNAIKFTPKGGEVIVIAHPKGDNMIISVRDNGIGISRGKLANLFSVKNSSGRGTAGEKGTGLGLVLVRDLTELNKGTVAVETIEGNGSTFTVSLPSR